MGLPLWSVEDYFNPALTSTMIVTIFTILYRAMIDSQVNIKLHPELIRLTQNDEEKENASDIASSEWLRRWLIYIRNPIVKRHGRNLSNHSSGSLALTINLAEDGNKGDDDAKSQEKKANLSASSLGKNLTPTTDEETNSNLASPIGAGMFFFILYFVCFGCLRMVVFLVYFWLFCSVFVCYFG